MDYNQQRRGMQNYGCRQQSSNCRRSDNSGSYPNGRYQRSMGTRPGYSSPRSGYTNPQNGGSGSRSDNSRPVSAPSCPCSEEQSASRPALCPSTPCEEVRNSHTCEKEKTSEKKEKDICSDFVLSMAYIKWQEWGSVYDPCDALSAGTLFPCLNKPFCAGRCR